MGGFGLGFNDRRSLIAARFLFVLMCFVRTPLFEEKLMVVRPPIRFRPKTRQFESLSGHQRRATLWERLRVQIAFCEGRRVEKDTQAAPAQN